MEKVSLHPEQLGFAFMLARPRIPVLVTSQNLDGSTNVAPFNWNTPTSVDPPLVMLALQVRPKYSDTLRNIRRTGEFVVNQPGIDLAERLVLASYEHGEGVSKFDLLAFTPLASRRVRPPGIGECVSHLECRVVRIHGDLGDHDLVIGEVLAAHYDPSAFSPSLIRRAGGPEPMVHLGQEREDGGQVHTFLIPGGTTRVRVPYPPR